MSYGFLAKNDSNFIQIDDNFPGYAVWLSGTVTVSSTNWYPGSTLPSSSDVGQPWTIVNLPDGIDPGTLILAVKPNSQSGTTYIRGVMQHYLDGSTKKSAVAIAASPGATIKYRVLRKTQDLTAGTGYGLNIFNASSGLVFSSDSGQYRVRSFHTGNINTRSASYTISLSDLSGIYVVCQNLGQNGQVVRATSPPAFSSRVVWNAAEFNYSANTIRIGVPTEVLTRLNTVVASSYYDYINKPNQRKVSIGKIT
tara:strand:- start:9519 stop:10277 length:759 start_codon:yes stop_codon:yes gene_type:complete